MGIKALGYVVIETAQPEKWDHFLTQLAGTMRAHDAADGARHYRMDQRPFRLRLEISDRERFKAAAYEVASRGEQETLMQRVEASGRPVHRLSAAECALRGVTEAFRTSDPAGNGLEFYHGDSAVDDVAFASPIGISEFVTGDMGMGHAVLSAPNFAETLAFYRDVIGFHETDMPAFHLMGPDAPPIHFAFMHADNGRHHSIAIGEGPVPPSGAVHIMMQYPNLVEVGKAYDRMKQFGYPESASMGQHFNDQTVGFYVQTPSGFDLEIGCDSLVIDPARWEVTRHEGISIWGHEWAWQKAMKAAQAEAAE